MPRINIEWVEGRTKEQRDELARKITQACIDVINVPAESVSISFRENKAENMYRAGKSLADLKKK
jgi:4-oxalocrotonate tautomerase